MVDKKQLRGIIVKAARNVFSQKGYRLTTMAEIAKAANMPKSSIYYYFATKQHILVAVIEREGDMLISGLTNASKQVSDPVEKFKSHVTSRVILFNNLGTFYKAIHEDFFEHLQFIEQVRKKYDEEEVQILENILIQGINQNLFNISDTKFAAAGIATALKGLEIPLFWTNSDPNLEERTQQLLHILLNGIVKSKI